MIQISMQRLAQVVDGELYGDPETQVCGVSHDSRQCRPEQLFVAIAGERYDGHDFIQADLAAAALLVARHIPVDTRPQVVVSDTLEALTRLARYWRGQCKARVVALTGSNGKTSTKEMLRAILGCAGEVHATQGNLNNHIGVPLTLLQLPMSADFAVIEMGANHIGEIAGLTACAQPDVALITNAGRAHIDGFGSLDGVAQGKGEIYQGLPAGGGVAIINLDDRYAAYWQGLNQDRPWLGFGLDAPQAVLQTRWAAPNRVVLRSNEESEASVTLAAPGRHTAYNAAAAATAALALGVDFIAIVQGLGAWQPVSGRLRAYQHASGASIWDDTYNANPESTLAALEVLAAAPGQRRILVLGDMLELGAQAIAWHAEIGVQAKALGIDLLLASGPLSMQAVVAFDSADGHWFSSQADLLVALREVLGPGTVILIKGSRGQRMEQILHALDPLESESESESGSESGSGSGSGSEPGSDGARSGGAN